MAGNQNSTEYLRFDVHIGQPLVDGAYVEAHLESGGFLRAFSNAMRHHVGQYVYFIILLL